MMHVFADSIVEEVHLRVSISSDIPQDLDVREEAEAEKLMSFGEAMLVDYCRTLKDSTGRTITIMGQTFDAGAIVLVGSICHKASEIPALLSAIPWRRLKRSTTIPLPGALGCCGQSDDTDTCAFRSVTVSHPPLFLIAQPSFPVKKKPIPSFSDLSSSPSKQPAPWRPPRTASLAPG